MHSAFAARRKMGSSRRGRATKEAADACGPQLFPKFCDEHKKPVVDDASGIEDPSSFRRF
jgi:hypothetical protein